MASKLRKMRVLSGAIGALTTASRLIDSMRSDELQNVPLNIAGPNGLNDTKRTIESQAKRILIDEVSKLSPVETIDSVASIRYYAKKVNWQ